MAVKPFVSPFRDTRPVTVCQKNDTAEADMFDAFQPSIYSVIHSGPSFIIGSFRLKN